MKNKTAKISAPQSMDALGKEILTFCKSKDANPQDIDTIIAELEDMKTMLEDYKKKNNCFKE